MNKIIFHVLVATFVTTIWAESSVDDATGVKIPSIHELSKVTGNQITGSNDKSEDKSEILNDNMPPINGYSEYWENFEAPYEIRKEYPYYHAGYDDENRPIWIMEIGKWNFRKSVEAGGQVLKQFDRWCVQVGYRVLRSMNESSTEDNPVEGVVAILDFDGLNLHQASHIPTLSFVIRFIRRHLDLIENHLHYGVAVNVNAIAQSVINIMRPVLGRSFERIEIYGTNKNKFIPHLLKHCPKESLPNWYGGSLKFKPVTVYG